MVGVNDAHAHRYSWLTGRFITGGLGCLLSEITASLELGQRYNPGIMRTISDIFAQILRTLRAHKLRSPLTMFGVSWGVGSLLLLVGLGEGFRSGNQRGLVTQRTREIGVEKALGARRSHILFQFLAESLTITFIGGALGVILAYGVSLSVGRLTLYSAMAKNAEAGDVRLIIAPSTLIVATLILAAVGLVSGMVPAIRAARLDPIEALRHE